MPTNTASSMYQEAISARRAIVIETMQKAHRQCPAEYSTLRAIGAEQFIIDYCSYHNFNMVLRKSANLLCNKSSAEQLYVTLATVARQHPARQTALDAHAAAKAVLRAFVTIADSSAVRRRWAAAGIRLSRSICRIMQTTAAGTSPAPITAQ